MTEHHLPTSLGLKIYEIVVIAAVAVVYIYLRTMESNPLLVAIIGFTLALWAIIKPTEWAVEGLNMLAQRLGIGTYAAGVIGSIMANLPELILATLLILKGEPGIAILTVLVVAGANTLLFGVVTVKSSRKTGHVKVPVTTLRYESELMMVAFVSALFLFVFNFAEMIEGKTTHGGVQVPVLFSVGTVAIYIFFLIFIARDKSLSPEITEEEKIELLKAPALQWNNIIKFLVLGTIGVVIAGELLANGAELLIHEAETSGIHLTEAHIALIVGALGSLPEWAVAFKAGDDIELVFGSVLSSISATLLFMIGLVSIFVFFTGEGFILDSFAIVQVVLSGSILLFVNLLMKDDLKLDTFEGICIIILQLIGFDVLLSV
ncbi:MAG: hypothetical protein INQ03_24880 [Candidatus Heimdallarchaeota archaeon]|nr:hypothetical protein [Candidatus Heimdallarchaeota archaeon]